MATPAPVQLAPKVLELDGGHVLGLVFQDGWVFASYWRPRLDKDEHYFLPTEEQFKRIAACATMPGKWSDWVRIVGKAQSLDSAIRYAEGAATSRHRWSEIANYIRSTSWGKNLA